MNTAQAVEHGKRWIAAGWTWKVGQVAIACGRGSDMVVLVTAVRGGSVTEFDRISGGHLVEWPELIVPDPRDEGTRGHMIGQVREAWSRPGITTKRHPALGWIVIDGHDDFLKSVACDSEPEALLAAREAAPGMKPTPPG